MKYIKISNTLIKSTELAPKHKALHAIQKVCGNRNTELQKFCRCGRYAISSMQRYLDIFLSSHGLTMDKYTYIPVDVLKSDLSITAKGLFMLIRCFCTMPNYKIKKGFFKTLSALGRDNFNEAWKELQKSGYLHKTLCRKKDGTLDYAYSLTDSATDTVADFQYTVKKSQSAKNQYTAVTYLSTIYSNSRKKKKKKARRYSRRAAARQLQNAENQYTVDPLTEILIETTYTALCKEAYDIYLEYNQNQPYTDFQHFNPFADLPKFLLSKVVLKHSLAFGTANQQRLNAS